MAKKGTKILDLTKGQDREQLADETDPKAIKRFTALAVKYVVADESIELVYFSTGSPDLNLTEEYWRRLNLTLGNRYFGSCDEIRSVVWTALESISPPGVYQYLCL